MVTLRDLTLGDAPALTRVYSGASIRHTTGKPLTLDQAHEKIRTALARAADPPCAVELGHPHRRRADRPDLPAPTNPGHGHHQLHPPRGHLGQRLRHHTAHQVVTVAFTTAGLNRLEAMHHPDNPASGRVLVKAGFARVGTADPDTETGTVPYELYALESGA